MSSTAAGSGQGRREGPRTRRWATRPEPAHAPRGGRLPAPSSHGSGRLCPSALRAGRCYSQLVEDTPVALQKAGLLASTLGPHALATPPARISETPARPRPQSCTLRPRPSPRPPALAPPPALLSKPQPRPLSETCPSSGAACTSHPQPMAVPTPGGRPPDPALVLFPRKQSHLPIARQLAPHSRLRVASGARSHVVDRVAGRGLPVCAAVTKRLLSRRTASRPGCPLRVPPQLSLDLRAEGSSHELSSCLSPLQSEARAVPRHCPHQQESCLSPRSPPRTCPCERVSGPCPHPNLTPHTLFPSGLLSPEN